MAGELGLALFDATKSAIFGTRNIDKTMNGDIIRAGVAAGQARNAVAAVSQFDSAIGHGAESWIKAIDTTAKSKSALGYVAKGVNFASNHVNKLLYLNGAVKTLTADDKVSEGINQTCAIGTMRLFEETSRALMTSAGRKALSKRAFAQKGIVSKALDMMSRLDKYTQTAGASSPLAKFGIPIAKGIAFVGLSIAGYSIGNKIGKAINSVRNDGKTNEKTQVSPRPMNMADLTGVKPLSEKEMKAVMSYRA